MKMKLTSILSTILVLALVVSLIPKIPGKAAPSGNITSTITFRFHGETLIFEGEGEIPDYVGNAVLTRPWSSQYYDKVTIDSRITRIGQNAFSYNSNLKYVDMSSTTFVADSSSFTSINPDCIFRLHGEVPAYEVLGNVTYSSWQSIAAAAPSGKDSIFILDSDMAAAQFRALRYPNYNFVYSQYAKDNPWLVKTRYFSEDAFSSVCKIANPNGAGLSFAKEPTSESFMKNMGEFTKLFNYNYANSYKSYYFEKGKAVYGQASETKRLVLNLDPIHQVGGVNYKLLQITFDQQLFIYDDLDTDYKTVTFATTNPSGIYILVY